MITSPDNARIKLVRALFNNKKTRDETGLFPIEGIRLCEEALAAGWIPQLTLHTPEISARGLELLQSPQLSGAEIVMVTMNLLEKATSTKTPQGIVMVFKQPEVLNIKNPNPVLVCDRLSDPGNLGTLLRCARAFGVQAVLVTSESADVWAPKTLRAGMGAHFHVWVQEMTEEQIIKMCKFWGLKIFLADMRGKYIWKTDLKIPLALVIGGEAEGAGQGLRAACDEKIAIPMPAGSESLNAAVSGSIILYEIMRQRLS